MELLVKTEKRKKNFVDNDVHDALKFYQMLFSRQIKRTVVIIKKHDICEFLHDLPHDLRPGTLGN